MDNQPISNRWEKLGNVIYQEITCASVTEEWYLFLPGNLPHAVLEYGLHHRPVDLITALQAKEEPEANYLTKGWIAGGDKLFEEHQKIVEKFGEAKTQRLTQPLLKKFKRYGFKHTR